MGIVVLWGDRYRRRARLASCFAAVAERPTMGAISSKARRTCRPSVTFLRPWPPNQNRAAPGTRRSPARGRRASWRWRRCSPRGAATRRRSRAWATQPTPTTSSRERWPASRPGRYPRRPDVRGVARLDVL